MNYFDEFQLSKGVTGRENSFNEYPECYFAINERYSECLFLEDLRQGNFDMIQHPEKLATFEHVSLMMKTLGKFHAISFALKDQQPEKFKELTGHINEQFWTLWESYFKRHISNTIKHFEDILEKENRLDLLEKLKKHAVGDDYFATIRKLISSESSEHAVICHGDATVNNSMFRNDKQGKPIDIRIFDFQFSRYASPVTELVLYLFGATTKELRDQHYEDFLKIYHGSLSELLIR